MDVTDFPNSIPPPYRGFLLTHPLLLRLSLSLSFPRKMSIGKMRHIHHNPFYDWVLSVTDPSRTRHSLTGSVTTVGNPLPPNLRAWSSCQRRAAELRLKRKSDDLSSDSKTALVQFWMSADSWRRRRSRADRRSSVASRWVTGWPACWRMNWPPAMGYADVCAWATPSIQPVAAAAAHRAPGSFADPHFHPAEGAGKFRPPGGCGDLQPLAAAAPALDPQR